MHQSLLVALMVQSKGLGFGFFTTLSISIWQQNITEPLNQIAKYQNISQPVLCKSDKVKLSGLLKIYARRVIINSYFSLRGKTKFCSQFLLLVLSCILLSGKQKTCNVLPLGTKFTGNSEIGWFFKTNILRKLTFYLCKSLQATNPLRNVTRIMFDKCNSYSLPDTMRASLGPTVCMLPISN